MSSFTKPLEGRYLGNNRWKLTKPFEYYTQDGKDIIKVPIGFITDGASIPRIFVSITGGHWSGKFGSAAVIHDYLYSIQIFTRKKTDKIFLEAMKVLGVSWLKRKTMYYAVRIGARWIWQKHKRELNND